jgi:hypothetical protein
MSWHQWTTKTRGYIACMLCVSSHAFSFILFSRSTTAEQFKLCRPRYALDRGAFQETSPYICSVTSLRSFLSRSLPFLEPLPVRDPTLSAKCFTATYCVVQTDSDADSSGADLSATVAAVAASCI